MAQHIAKIIEIEMENNIIIRSLIDFNEITWYRENLMIFDNAGKKFYGKNEVIESIQKRYKITMYFVEVSNKSRGVIHGEVIYNHSQDIRLEKLKIDFKTPVRFTLTLIDNVYEEELYDFEDPSVVLKKKNLKEHEGIAPQGKTYQPMSEIPGQAMQRQVKEQSQTRRDDTEDFDPEKHFGSNK